jgi:hypothetical protein
MLLARIDDQLEALEASVKTAPIEEDLVTRALMVKQIEDLWSQKIDILENPAVPVTERFGNWVTQNVNDALVAVANIEDAADARRTFLNWANEAIHTQPQRVVKIAANTLVAADELGSGFERQLWNLIRAGTETGVRAARAEPVATAAVATGALAAGLAETGVIEGHPLDVTAIGAGGVFAAGTVAPRAIPSIRAGQGPKHVSSQIQEIENALGGRAKWDAARFAERVKTSDLARLEPARRKAILDLEKQLQAVKRRLTKSDVISEDDVAEANALLNDLETNRQDLVGTFNARANQLRQKGERESQPFLSDSEIVEAMEKHAPPEMAAEARRIFEGTKVEERAGLSANLRRRATDRSTDLREKYQEWIETIPDEAWPPEGKSPSLKATRIVFPESNTFAGMYRILDDMEEPTRAATIKSLPAGLRRLVQDMDDLNAARPDDSRSTRHPTFTKSGAPHEYLYENWRRKGAAGEQMGPATSLDELVEEPKQAPTQPSRPRPKKTADLTTEDIGWEDWNSGRMQAPQNKLFKALLDQGSIRVADEDAYRRLFRTIDPMMRELTEEGADDAQVIRNLIRKLREGGEGKVADDVEGQTPEVSEAYREQRARNRAARRREEQAAREAAEEEPEPPTRKAEVADEIEGVPTRVQRVEEPDTPPGSVDKPHGLYTTPFDVESPHLDLGGAVAAYDINPNARVLDLTGSSPAPMRRGAIDSGAGVHAAIELIPELNAGNLPKSKAAAIRLASKHFPEQDFSGYYDAQEVIEALGGLKAKEAGYDAIWLPNDDPQFSEMVLLTDNAILSKDLEEPVVKPDTEIELELEETPQEQARRALTDLGWSQADIDEAVPLREAAEPEAPRPEAEVEEPTAVPEPEEAPRVDLNTEDEIREALEDPDAEAPDILIEPTEEQVTTLVDVAKKAMDGTVIEGSFKPELVKAAVVATGLGALGYMVEYDEDEDRRLRTAAVAALLGGALYTDVPAIRRGLRIREVTRKPETAWMIERWKEWDILQSRPGARGLTGGAPKWTLKMLDGEEVNLSSLSKQEFDAQVDALRKKVQQKYEDQMRLVQDNPDLYNLDELARIVTEDQRALSVIANRAWHFRQATALDLPYLQPRPWRTTGARIADMFAPMRRVPEKAKRSLHNILSEEKVNVGFYMKQVNDTRMAIDAAKLPAKVQGHIMLALDEKNPTYRALFWHQLVNDRQDLAARMGPSAPDPIALAKVIQAQSESFLEIGQAAGIFGPELSAHKGAYFPRLFAQLEYEHVEDFISSGRPSAITRQFFEQTRKTGTLREAQLAGHDPLGDLPGMSELNLDLSPRTDPKGHAEYLFNQQNVRDELARFDERFEGLNIGEFFEAYGYGLMRRVYGEEFKRWVEGARDEGWFVSKQDWNQAFEEGSTLQIIGEQFVELPEHISRIVNGPRYSGETLRRRVAIKHDVNAMLWELRKAERLIHMAEVKEADIGKEAMDYLNTEVLLYKELGASNAALGLIPAGKRGLSNKKVLFEQSRKYMEQTMRNFRRTDAWNNRTSAEMREIWEDEYKELVEILSGDAPRNTRETMKLAEKAIDFVDRVRTARGIGIGEETRKALRTKLRMEQLERVYGEFEMTPRTQAIVDNIRRVRDELEADGVAHVPDAVTNAAGETMELIQRLKAPTGKFAELGNDIAVIKKNIETLRQERAHLQERMNRESQPLLVRKDVLPLMNEMIPMAAVKGGHIAPEWLYNASRITMKTALSAPMDLYMIGNTGKTALGYATTGLIAQGLNVPVKLLWKAGIHVGNPNGVYGAVRGTMAFNALIKTAWSIAHKPDTRHMAELRLADEWADEIFRQDRTGTGVGSPWSMTETGYSMGFEDAEFNTIAGQFNNLTGGNMPGVSQFANWYERGVIGSERLQFSGWVRPLKVMMGAEAARNYIAKNGGRNFDHALYEEYRAFDKARIKYRWAERMNDSYGRGRMAEVRNENGGAYKDAVFEDNLDLFWQSKGIDPDSDQVKEILDLEWKAYEYAAKVTNGAFGGKNLRSTGASPKTLKTMATYFGASNWLSTRVELFKGALDPFEWKDSAGKQWALSTALQAPIAYATLTLAVSALNGEGLPDWAEFWNKFEMGMDPTNLRHFMDVQMPDGTWVSPFTWEKDIVKIGMGFASLPDAIASNDWTNETYLLEGYTQARLSIMARLFSDLVFNKNFAHKRIRDENDLKGIAQHLQQVAANTTPSAVMSLMKAAPIANPFDEDTYRSGGFPWTVHESMGDKLFGQGQVSMIGAVLDVIGFGRARTTNVADAQVWEWNTLGLWVNDQGVRDPSIQFIDYRDMSDASPLNKMLFKAKNPFVVKYFESGFERDLAKAEERERDRVGTAVDLFTSEPKRPDAVADYETYAEQFTLGSLLDEVSAAEAETAALWRLKIGEFGEPESYHEKLIADFFAEVVDASRIGSEEHGVISRQLMDLNLQKWINNNETEDYLYVLNYRLASERDQDSPMAQRDRAMVAITLMGGWDELRFWDIPTKEEEAYYLNLAGKTRNAHNLWLEQEWRRTGVRPDSGGEAASAWLLGQVQMENVQSDMRPFISSTYGVDYFKLKAAMGQTDAHTGWDRFRNDNPGLVVWLDDRADWRTVQDGMDHIEPPWLKAWIQAGGTIPDQLKNYQENQEQQPALPR